MIPRASSRSTHSTLFPRSRCVVLVTPFFFLPLCCIAQPFDSVVLKHLYNDGAPNGFADFRGRAWKGDQNIWDSLTCLQSVDSCWVSWSGKLAKLVISVNAKPFATFDLAHADFLQTVAFIQHTFPKLTPVYPRQGSPDDERIFFDPTAVNRNGQNYSNTINVRVEQSKTGLYETFVVIDSDPSEKVRRNALANANALATYVRADVKDYLDAAQTRFMGMKKGPMRVRSQNGLHSWDASWKPLLAELCEIQEVPDQVSSVLCVLSRSPYQQEIIAKASELATDISSALPSGWSRQTTPPFPGSIYSIGFVSTSGESGQVWVDLTADRTYSLDYRIVSAPVR